MATSNIKQFRYFGTKNTEQNQLTINNHINSLDDIENKDFLSELSPIKKIGIQTMPGVKFYLNNEDDPIIIGASGIFELDLLNTSASITQLIFDQDSLKNINNAPGGYLIIDVIGNYSGGDE